MVKAHSLLYAIYVCLIVALLCSAFLYISNLYNQLNAFYVTHEELYIHNQSLVNYALANIDSKSGELPDDGNTIKGIYKTTQYGLFNIVTAQSCIANDTVTSVHFAGKYNTDDTCIYLTDFSTPITYSGKVTLTGNKKVPSGVITPVYITGTPNELIQHGAVSPSGKQLPEPDSKLSEFFEIPYNNITDLKKIQQDNTPVYFNSFVNPSVYIHVSNNLLANITVRGNVILFSNDSIVIDKTANLKDVIISAPVITFNDGYDGNVQAFATSKISVGKNVNMQYPSVLCLYNKTTVPAAIKFGRNSTLAGSILLFGFPLRMMYSNSIDIDEGGLITGDIYCQGRLLLKSSVYGSVYTNKLLYKTPVSEYENCIANLEIDISKRPEYFISPALFKNNTAGYGLYKKIF